MLSKMINNAGHEEKIPGINHNNSNPQRRFKPKELPTLRLKTLGF